jgi:hypothetical protein
MARPMEPKPYCYIVSMFLWLLLLLYPGLWIGRGAYPADASHFCGLFSSSVKAI